MIKVEYLVKPRTSFNGVGNYPLPPSAALGDPFLSFISNIKFYPVQQFFLRNLSAELLHSHLASQLISNVKGCTWSYFKCFSYKGTKALILKKVLKSPNTT